MAYQEALRVRKKSQSPTTTCWAWLCFKLFSRVRGRDCIDKENSVMRIRIEDEKQRIERIKQRKTRRKVWRANWKAEAFSSQATDRRKKSPQSELF